MYAPSIIVEIRLGLNVEPHIHERKLKSDLSGLTCRSAATAPDRVTLDEHEFTQQKPTVVAKQKHRLSLS